jgi:hypothetical protein
MSHKPVVTAAMTIGAHPYWSVAARSGKIRLQPSMFVTTAEANMPSTVKEKKRADTEESGADVGQDGAGVVHQIKQGLQLAGSEWSRRLWTTVNAQREKAKAVPRPPRNASPSIHCEQGQEIVQQR